MLFPDGLRSLGFPGGSDGQETACNARDPGSIPGSGRSTGERNGYPLQYSCLETCQGHTAEEGIVPCCCGKIQGLGMKRFKFWFLRPPLLAL